MGRRNRNRDEAELASGFAADGFEAREIGFGFEPGVTAGMAFDGAQAIIGEGV